MLIYVVIQEMLRDLICVLFCFYSFVLLVNLVSSGRLEVTSVTCHACRWNVMGLVPNLYLYVLKVVH